MRRQGRASAALACLLLAPAAGSSIGASAQEAGLKSPDGAEACRGSVDWCPIAPGLRYRMLTRTTPRQMTIHVAEVALAGPGVLVAVTPADRTAGMEYRAATTSRFLLESGALLAVNASYFLPFVGGSLAGSDFVPQPGQAANASGAVLAGGAMLSPVDSVDARVDSMACFAPGRAAIVDGQACPEGFPEGVSAGPRLLRAGTALPRPNVGADGIFHGAVVLPEQPADAKAPAGGGPRTALGVSADGKLLWLMVVDGRQPGHSEGASHDDLVALFRGFGATDAMSLDGGGSATMAARGVAGPVLLNRPIHTRVPGRERPVANHVGVFVGPAAPRRPAGFLPPLAERTIPRMAATLERIWDAPEARQGVAADARHFYAIVNTAIGKYDRASGQLLTRWAGPRGGLIRHLNSCTAIAANLMCANSNHPETPMASSIEWFDLATLAHRRSHSLGLMDEGSLTFVEPLEAGYLAGFAHYSDETGHPFKPHDFSSLILMNADFQRTGGYAIPPGIRARMRPQAASGGAIGPDGLLYLFGHTLPELYVLARPVMGAELLHLATIDLDAAGQAFSFVPGQGRRILAIDRPTGTVRQFLLPEIGALPVEARLFPRK